MRLESKSERGSVTAELAIAMPAVSLVIAITLGAFSLQIERMKLVDVGATAARAIARGESEEEVRKLARELVAGELATAPAPGSAPASEAVQIEFSMLEKLACVKISKDIELPGLAAKVFSLAESQCARKMGL